MAALRPLFLWGSGTGVMTQCEGKGNPHNALRGEEVKVPGCCQYLQDKSPWHHNRGCRTCCHKGSCSVRVGKRHWAGWIERL